MFDWVWKLFLTKTPKPAAELDMSQWGMGDPLVTIKDGGPNFPMGVDAQDHGLGELEWKNMRQAPNELRISAAARPDDPKGGYGGLCIPDGTVLPGTIDGEPTCGIVNRIRSDGDGGLKRDLLIRPGQKHWAPHGDADFNFTKLDGVENPTSLKSASITNGYDRRIVLEGPVLTLVLQPGETRTIASPIHQRVPSVFKEGELFNPNKFSVRGYSAYQVLRDLAAESTRAIIRNQPPEKWRTDVDFATVDEILAVSKFTVQEL